MFKKEAAPIISVIICTYNTKKLTIECLNNLIKSIKVLDRPVEIVVIENGSDGTADLIRKNYPWIKLLNPKENTGFAKGNNLGIKAANKKTKYYLFLNTDAMVKKDTLRKALDFIENKKDLGVLGCKLTYANGELQPSAGDLPTPLLVWSWIWGLDLLPLVGKTLKQVHPKYPEYFKKSKEVGWVMGAFFLMTRGVIERTGGFDENFFMYMEEVEWCKRIKDAGFKIWFTPQFEITHLDKASSKGHLQNLERIYRSETMGIIYYLRKHYRNSIFWLIPVIKIGLFARALAFKIKGNEMRYRAYHNTLLNI